MFGEKQISSSIVYFAFSCALSNAKILVLAPVISMKNGKYQPKNPNRSSFSTE